MTAELEIIGSNQVLAGTRADIQVRCYRDGELTSPTGTLTYAVVDANGTAVASGTPTSPSTGILSIVLTAAQIPNPAILTVTWGGLVFGSDPAVSIVTEHEAIGAWLFTLSEARAFDKEKLGAETTFPSATILEARDRIAAQFADILAFAPGARFKREIYDGDGSDTLWLDGLYVREVSAVSVRTFGSQTWTALTIAELAALTVKESGGLVREGGTWPIGRQNVRVAYEAGMQPIAPELKRAALEVLSYQILGSNLDPRATSLTNEMGTQQLATAGRGRGDVRQHYGLPNVDAVLNRLSRKLPGIA